MKGIVQVYTGDGKGKTTSAFGLALRAMGQELSVFVVQFLKSGQCGEHIAVQKFLPNFKVAQFGREALDAFVWEFGAKKAKVENEKFRFLSDEEEKVGCQLALEYSQAVVTSKKYDVVILDEINCAMAKGLVSVDDVLKLIDKKPESVELVLTGRGAPKQIVERADLVTEMKKVKHPYDDKFKARKGIEY